MFDPEKELMYTVLYNIAYGGSVITHDNMINLAMKTIE